MPRMRKLQPKRDATHEVMEAGLRSIQNGAWRPELAAARFDVLRTPDIQNLSLVTDEPPDGGLYDHDFHRRAIYLSSPLAGAFDDYWKQSDAPFAKRRTLAELFLAHEIFHVGQRVDSDTYIFSTGSDFLFDPLDYSADAFAAEVVFNLERDVSQPWTACYANILLETVKGSRVFDLVEGGSKESMDGARLRRQLSWIIQCARMACFNPGRTTTDFEITSPCAAELFKFDQNKRKINLTATGISVAFDDIKSATQLHVLATGRRYVMGLTDPKQGVDLAKCLFAPTVQRCVNVMRTLFSTNPTLTGRTEHMRILKQDGLFLAQASVDQDRLNLK